MRISGNEEFFPHFFFFPSGLFLSLFGPKHDLNRPKSPICYELIWPSEGLFLTYLGFEDFFRGFLPHLFFFFPNLKNKGLVVEV